MRVFGHLFQGELATAESRVEENTVGNRRHGQLPGPYGAVGLAAFRGREFGAGRVL
jgi:hypothetical protein